MDSQPISSARAERWQWARPPPPSPALRTPATSSTWRRVRQGLHFGLLLPKADTPAAPRGLAACAMRIRISPTKHHRDRRQRRTRPHEAFKEKYHFPFTALWPTTTARSSRRSASPVTRFRGWSLRAHGVFSDQQEGRIVWRDLKASTKEQAPTVLESPEKPGRVSRGGPHGQAGGRVGSPIAD